MPWPKGMQTLITARKTARLLILAAIVATLSVASAEAHRVFGQGDQVCAEDPPGQVLLIAQFQDDFGARVRAYDSRSGYMGQETIPPGGNALFSRTFNTPIRQGGVITFIWHATGGSSHHGVLRDNYTRAICLPF